MAFSDHFDADDAAGLAEDLGEPVVYVKRQGGRVERREVDAIVRRQPNRFDRSDANGGRTMRTKPIRIEIPTGGPRGISPAELDTGTDTIELCRVAGHPDTICELGLHEPGENERTQNDVRFQTFELY